MTVPTMTVNVKAPAMVFVGGLLLPHGTFQIVPKPLAPSTCDVTILRDSPQLPGNLRERFAAIAPDAKGIDPDLAVRAFMTVQNGAASMFVELDVINAAFVKSKAPAPLAAVPPEAPPADAG